MFTLTVQKLRVFFNFRLADLANPADYSFNLHLQNQLNLARKNTYPFFPLKLI